MPTINKGRDFYRALQAKCKRLSNNPRLPNQNQSALNRNDLANFTGQPSKPLFFLSDRCYEKIHILNKKFKFIGKDGKEHYIPYQTCTYIRTTPELA